MAKGTYYDDQGRALTKKQKAEYDSVNDTVPVRISRYLRDQLMEKAKGYGSPCVARQLLVALDPKMAEKWPRLPSQRR